jgi:hypothetical protein
MARIFFLRALEATLFVERGMLFYNFWRAVALSTYYSSPGETN